MTTTFILFVLSTAALGALIVRRQLVGNADTSSLSLAFERWSPVVERAYDAVHTRITALRNRAHAHSSHIMRRTFEKGKTVVRGFVIVLAAKMIEAVKGEKMLHSNGAPSLFLKRLRESSRVSSEGSNGTL